jgi:hypothetical protein
VVSGEEILNLLGLSSLDSVVSLQIKNTKQLVNLVGLENVKIIETLDLKNNASLKSTVGLDNLISVEKELIVQTNPLLESLASFKSLKELTKLRIVDNYSLINLDGFNNVKSIKKDLSIVGNHQLKNLYGLGGLQQVGTLYSGTFYINRNASLTSLDGVTSLEQINWELKIVNNGALTDLTGLEKVTNMKSLTLLGNAQLRSLDGLQNVETCTSRIEIGWNNGNPSLTDYSAIASILKERDWNGETSQTSIIIEKNAYNPTESDFDNGNYYVSEDIKTIHGDIRLSSQAQIDIFNASYIAGDLTIEPYQNCYITNLSGLLSLDSIKNTLYILGNQKLESLDGIDNLTKAGDGRTIYIGGNNDDGNPLLSDFCAAKDFFISHTGSVMIRNNFYSPTIDDLADGKCKNSAPSVPNMISPYNQSTNNSPEQLTFIWNKSSDEDNDSLTYALYLKPADRSYYSKVHTTGLTSCLNSDLIYSHQVKEKNSYMCFVEVDDGYGCTVNSDTISFSMGNNNSTPDIPVLNTPENEANIILSDEITFTWLPSSDVDNDSVFYNIALSENNYDLENKIIASGLTETSYTVSDLDFGKIYYWSVWSSDKVATSENSEVWSFTTETANSNEEVEILINNGFKIYPIPCQQEITVKTKYDCQKNIVKIYALNGTLVFETEFNTREIKINLNQKSGAYIINVYNKEHNHKQLLIIQ